MNWELLSPVIIVSCALGFVALEHFIPYDRGQRIFREGFWVDLVGYGLVQSYLLGLLISMFIAWLDRFRASIGIPRSLREVGVKPEQVPALIENALADACHTFNPRQPVTAQDFEALFREAL